jgi:hypothetical protein
MSCVPGVPKPGSLPPAGLCSLLEARPSRGNCPRFQSCACLAPRLKIVCVAGAA